LCSVALFLSLNHYLSPSPFLSLFLLNERPYFLIAASDAEPRAKATALFAGPVDDMVDSDSDDDGPKKKKGKGTKQPPKGKCYARDLFSTLLKASLEELPLLVPDASVFCSSKGSCGFEAYQKAVPGNLFLLRGGVLSMNKPMVFLPRESISEIRTARNGTRSFDLFVEPTNGPELEFNMIPVDEMERMGEYTAFVARMRKKALKGENGVEKADKPKPAAAPPRQERFEAREERNSSRPPSRSAAELAKTATKDAGAGADEDDDDDSDDGSFCPSDSSEPEGEYDEGDDNQSSDDESDDDDDDDEDGGEGDGDADGDDDKMGVSKGAADGGDGGDDGDDSEDKFRVERPAH
jgi:hypothetical protein